MTPLEALKRYFGYDSFRPGQADIVDALLAGQDVLAVMPTGAGKSLCYQIPALLLPGVTLVVSPLISLMQDQVAALEEEGVHAACLNSALPEGLYSTILRAALETEDADMLRSALHRVVPTFREPEEVNAAQGAAVTVPQPDGEQAPAPACAE